MLTNYNTNTNSQRKERESNPQGRFQAPPVSNRAPSPIGWPFRVQRRERRHEYPDQESNPERLVRSET
jgi:hypothetical protein